MESLRGVYRRYKRTFSNLHVFIFLFIGAWPLKSGESNRYLKYVHFLLHSVFIYYFLLTLIQLIDIESKLDDFGLLAEAGAYLIFLLKDLVRIGTILLRQNDVWMVFDDVENLCLRPKNKTESKIFEKYKRLSLWGSIVMLVIYPSLAVIFTLQPLMEVGRRFPGHITLPFNFDYLKSPFYEAIYSVSIISAWGSAVAVAIGDSAIMTVLLTMIGEFKILQFKLENMKQYAATNIEGKESQQEHCVVNEAVADIDTKTNVATQVGTSLDQSSTVRNINQQINIDSYCNLEDAPRGKSTVIIQPRPTNSLEENGVVEKACKPQTSFIPKRPTKHDKDILCQAMVDHLVECAKYHQELLRVFQRLQNRISVVMFLEISVTGVNICLYLFEIVSVQQTKPQLVILLIFMAMVFVDLFFYCFLSTMLADESVIVADAMYFSDWLEYSVTLKSSMLTVMSRALSPIQLTAVNFLPINMDIFTKVSNSGYSYFTLMGQLHNEKQ